MSVILYASEYLTDDLKHTNMLSVCAQGYRILFLAKLFFLYRFCTFVISRDLNSIVLNLYIFLFVPLLSSNLALADSAFLAAILTLVLATTASLCHTPLPQAAKSKQTQQYQNSNPTLPCTAIISSWLIYRVTLRWV